MTAGGATVEVDGACYDLEPGGSSSFTFGRSVGCTVCLDADDVGISRTAGSVDWVEGFWFVTNRSEVCALFVADSLGFRAVLGPGRRVAADGRLSIEVKGQVLRHELVVTGPGFAAPALGIDLDDEGTLTDIGAGVKLNTEDRMALAAMDLLP